MSNINSALLQNIQNRYLNENAADVWFVFDGERIPGHRIILASSPWLENMFFGSLTENAEVNMSNHNVTAGSFKEFLRYIYTGTANLTMDNIDEMIYLADESLCQEILDECEKFLIKELSVNNIFTVYQLALRHERARRLKAICEDEICVNAERTFRTGHFNQIQYDFLQNILKCDSLVCEEKDVFNACVAWAKAACRRNKIDQHNPINLRAQLGDSIYQIRFSSMTIGDAATCIQSCPGLFSEEELREIMCMIGHKNYSGTMRFNWSPRYFSLQRDTSQEFMCNRYSHITPDEYYNFKTTETTSFTCNRRVLLKGFTTECNQSTTKPVNIAIVETNTDGDVNIRHNGREVLHFSRAINRKKKVGERQMTYTSHEATVQLNNVILLRPGYTYEMTITFERDPFNLKHNCKLKNKVRVNHDIVFRFNNSKEMVTSFTFSRLDNTKYFRKIIHNPKMWFLLIVLLLVIAFIIRYQPNSYVVSLWNWIKNLCK